MNARRIAFSAAALLALAGLRQARRPRLSGLGRGRSDLRQPRRGRPGRDAVGARRRHGREGRAAVHGRPRAAAGRRRHGEGRGDQRQQAYERAQTLLKTAAGTQKTLEDAEATLAHRAGAAQFGADAAGAPQDGQPGRRHRCSRSTTGPARWCRPGRPVVSLLPPGNIKVRFFVPETVLPKFALGDDVTIHCDGCKPTLPAQGDLHLAHLGVHAAGDLQPGGALQARLPDRGAHRTAGRASRRPAGRRALRGARSAK